MIMMLKTLICLLILTFTCTFATASPFLICDPQADVETYNVYQDGVLTYADHPAEPDGSLRLDLDGVTPGAYTFTAEACTGPWGCSAVSGPYLSPEPAQQPTGLSLTR